ncbi:hypothetical protein AK830_g4955 [Neonectria ditissima]|uniref:Protein kinase domain-containing protein n=1 Tax=Neonectria ditissima TaxID=78410 RepID=A0A0P7BM78_9HYPO|nr:hypothetical protein AK830_g4955 [Neonectria ditissima]
MPTNNHNIELLTLLVDSNDEEDSEYRFLVDGSHVKYVTVEPGALPKGSRTFEPALITALPSFPPGDWNEGHVSKDKGTGSLVFSHTRKSHLPSVKNLWHTTKLDHLEFTKVGRLRQNIHKVTHPHFDRPVLVKFAEFPWQMPFLEAETAAYQWINERGIGPVFLGHLKEDGRVFGIIIEHIEDAQTVTPEDLPACRAGLANLHALGIKHGDINKNNFLVRDGKAILIDFEASERCENQSELDAESDLLETSLKDTSYRGGEGPAISSESMPR